MEDREEELIYSEIFALIAFRRDDSAFKSPFHAFSTLYKDIPEREILVRPSMLYFHFVLRGKDYTCVKFFWCFINREVVRLAFRLNVTEQSI